MVLKEDDNMVKTSQLRKTGQDSQNKKREKSPRILALIRPYNISPIIM